MCVIEFPQSRVGPAALVELLYRCHALEPDRPEQVTLRFCGRCFLPMSTIALLTTWAMGVTARGGRISVEWAGRAPYYLERMDFFRRCGVELPRELPRRNERGRFIPLQLVDDERSAQRACDAICDLVLSQFDNAAAFLPAMEWAVYEVLDNIWLHAETPTPGVIVAQYYPKPPVRLEIAVCDFGRGIRASLGESLPLGSHEEAIRRAVQRGVTRNQAIGQGNGLAGSLAIMGANGGEFCLWSGDYFYRQRANTDASVPLATTVPGTGVFFCMKPEHPVDLSDTFIGDCDWSYLDALASRTTTDGGIRVAEECINFGTRATAGALRRRVQSILPVMEEPLVLDFAGVERASSSFLDELLGRLMYGLGEEGFRSQIQIINLAPRLMDMANVVIHQRLATCIGARA